MLFVYPHPFQGIRFVIYAFYFNGQTLGPGLHWQLAIYISLSSQEGRLSVLVLLALLSDSLTSLHFHAPEEPHFRKLDSFPVLLVLGTVFHNGGNSRRCWWVIDTCQCRDPLIVLASHWNLLCQPIQSRRTIC